VKHPLLIARDPQIHWYSSHFCHVIQWNMNLPYICSPFSWTCSDIPWLCPWIIEWSIWIVTKGKISGKTYQKIRAQNPTQSINPTHTTSVVVLPSIVSVQTGDRTAVAACTATKLNGLAHCHNPFWETFGKRKEGDSNE